MTDQLSTDDIDDVFFIDGRAVRTIPDIVSAPETGPAVLKPARTVRGFRGDDLGRGILQIGDYVLRTCETCDCFRKNEFGDGSCHHISHFERHLCEQFIGTRHGERHGFSPECCPLARGENGDWQPFIWWDHESQDWVDTE